MKIPDPNARAPRPSKKPVDGERLPGLDAPPPAARGDRPSFDKGMAAAESDAAAGQRPGQGDSSAVHAEGTADAPRTEKARHRNPKANG